MLEDYSDDEEKDVIAKAMAEQWSNYILEEEK